MILTSADLITEPAVAFAVTASKKGNPPSYICRAFIFVNEYGRKHPDAWLRSDSGPNNSNHLLGTFPVLLSYGEGGFDVNRLADVPYGVHAH